ncbi:nephrin, putative, partial [Ixodes scapularis]
FDPSIPGFPRYTMIVDTHRGVYNLRIQNVQLEDEAEYQCQVGPAHKNHAIWTAAQLNVLVPSKEVELRHRGNGSVVEVREAEHVNIACWVRNTKPVSHIKWFRNGSPLPKAKNILTACRMFCSLLLLNFLSFRLLRIKHLENQTKPFICRREIFIKYFLRRSAIYPPGVPEIEGYQDGDIVQVGDTLTLACISRGGNPPATLTWTKDGVLLTAKYKNATREATNTYTFTVTAGDNNAVYRCEATNLVTLQPFEASVKLSVLFAPSRVSITGPKEAKAGDMVTMTCTTAPSNPSVDVAWKLDGSAVQPASDQSTVQTKEGWVTSSNLTITLTRQVIDSFSFTCLAESQKLQETVIQSASLKIIYPPRPPVIIGYEEGTPIMAHSIQRIKCVSIGGNPLPTVKWYKGLKEYASLSTVTGSGVSSVLEIMAQPDDNQATYSCKAANSATTKPLTTSIKTTVLFAPKAVSITVVPQAPKEGDTVVLTCESGSSNPESSIQWLHNGNPTASHHQSRVDAQHGGKATRSRVRLNVTAADDGAVFTCRASNDIQEGAQDSVSLRVLHKPLFLHPPMEKYEVKQGETVLLNVSARANPSKMNYAWTKDGVPLPGPDDAYSWQETVAHKVFYRGPALHVYQAQKEDSGDYECEASNSQGATKTTIIVKVLYPATVTKISKYAMVGTGENASFECVVDANPLTEDVIRWRRQGFDMRRRTRVVLEKGRSYLTVYNVSDLDKGAFECVAHNGLGEEFVRSTLLIVKFKAVMHSPREPLTTVAADVGRSLRLSCSADGAPKVTFVWTVEDAVIAETATGGHRHAIHVEQLDVLRWESVLVVKYVHAQDYGQYSCTARNELGSDSARFRVRPRGKPDPPESIRVLNATHTSVLLSWTAGFNGGLDQQFRIRFRRTEDETNAYDYTDLIPEDVSLYLIGGLEPGTEYAFSVLGRNALGESEYSEESETTSTLCKPVYHMYFGRKGEVPRLLLVSVAVVGTLLLLLNAVLVICFVKRRKRRQQQ